MFPSQFTTLDEYIAFIERQLGSEVSGKIHLTMDNFRDIITISMKEFYREYQSESLSTKLYVIEVVAGKEEYKMNELMIYKRDANFGEAKLYPVQPNIFNVVDITEVSTASSFMAMGMAGGMDTSYMFYFNGNSGDGMIGMEKAQMAINQMRNVDYIRKLFQRKYFAEFNRADNILRIHPTPRINGFTAITVAEYNGFDSLINNDIFWKLTIANAKKQWSSNFMVFDDLSLDGGGKIDFKSICQEGKEEHAELMQYMEDHREPLMFFID